MDEFVSNLDALHHIQQAVLRQLTYSKYLSHTELLPDGMAGNAFNYHLNFLVKQKLIEKSDKGYTLSALGRIVVEAMSLDAKRFKLRPTCGVMLLLEDSERRVLIHKSRRQPLLDYAGLPFGKLRISANYKATAERMIIRKQMDLADVKDLKFHSPLNVIYEEDEETVCHRTGQIWHGLYTGDKKEIETQNGLTFWSAKDFKLKSEVGLAKSGELNDCTLVI
ncbi:hypothetical protein H6800_02505 [Candidatus Nomurabacteria bacterium]|nr:hypothetical protein [Candidatus Nomurabacteria bacterium]